MYIKKFELIEEITYWLRAKNDNFCVQNITNTFVGPPSLIKQGKLLIFFTVLASSEHQQ